MMLWPHKESTLWQWLPLSAPVGSRIGCPGVHLQAHSRKGSFSTGPLQSGFQFPCWRLLLISAAGEVVSVRISSSTSVRATLCCSSHLKDSFLLIPLVLTTVILGVCSNRYMVRGRWGPFPFFSSIPFTLTSNSALPYFLVFLCFVILLLPASTLIWILLLHALVFHVPLFSVSFTLSLSARLLDSCKPVQSPLERVQLHGPCRCQAACISGTGELITTIFHAVMSFAFASVLAALAPPWRRKQNKTKKWPARGQIGEMWGSFQMLWIRHHKKLWSSWLAFEVYLNLWYSAVWRGVCVLL